MDYIEYMITQTELNDRIVECQKKEFETVSDDKKRLLLYKKIIEIEKELELKTTISELINATYFEKSLINTINNSDLEELIIKSSNLKKTFFAKLLLQGSCKMEKEISNKYPELIKSYNNILNNYKQLASDLKFDSALELSNLLTYMLWNGYYSVNKVHNYKIKDRINLSGLYSLDVIKGSGVCLAYADLLQDYLNTCGKTANIINCIANKKNFHCNYVPEIERHLEKKNIDNVKNLVFMTIAKPLVKFYGNHAITLIEENDKLFLYDPTNLLVLNIKNKNKANIINGSGTFILKPYSSLIVHPDISNIKLFEKIVDCNIKQAYSRKEIIYSFEDTLERIHDNIKLLDDSYDNIYHELKFINKKIKIMNK